MVITGRKVLRVVSVLAVLSAVVFVVYKLVSGTSIGDILADYVNWLIVGGALLAGVSPFMFPAEKIEKSIE